MISSRLWPIRRGEPRHHRLQRRRRRRHRRSRRRRRRRPGGSAGRAGIASPSITDDTRAKVSASRANQPVVSEVGACGSMPVDVDAAVRRADAVEAAEARRHAHRAAGVGAERGVAEARGHRGGRARRRAAGHAAGRARVHRRAVEGVLAQDAERDLVGDGLADQRGAGVEQRLHRPGMPRRHRPAGRPVVVAAAGRHAGHVEQVLGGEGEAVRAGRRRGPRCARAGPARRRRCRQSWYCSESRYSAGACAARRARAGAPERLRQLALNFMPVSLSNHM